MAYLPSPARGVWHLGPLPVRGYALCAIAGVAVALWLADHRYRRMGGPRGMVLDVAVVAVPAGIIGARAYGVLTGYRGYFGPGRDWVSVFRIWDGGLGTAGIIAAGIVGAWAYCRHYGYWLTPLALAAAPALPVAQAIGVWGNWFNQRMYGSPSTLPFAVAISPERRANGYESFATFQPVFLYESVWDLLIAATIAYAIRRFALTGDRAFALYAGLYAAGRFVAELLRVDYAPRLLGIKAAELAALAVMVAAIAYLSVARARHADSALARPSADPLPAARLPAARLPAARQPADPLPAGPLPAGPLPAEPVAAVPRPAGPPVGGVVLPAPAGGAQEVGGATATSDGQEVPRPAAEPRPA